MHRLLRIATRAVNWSAVVALVLATAQAQSAPSKVILVGASLTQGMDLEEQLKTRGMEGLIKSVPETRRRSIGLGTLFGKVVTPPPRDNSDLFFFMAPDRRAADQVKAVQTAQPELVVGIDFLFWFGYWPNVQTLPKEGPDSDLLQGYGGPDREIEKAFRSLEKQREGFEWVRALLAKCNARVVLGDYPDMFGAHPTMLNPKHIPLRRTLDELNARVREFAKGEPRILLYPLADYVTRAKEGKLQVPDGSGRMLSVESAIQFDNLHPTRLGTALVAHELYGFLSEKLGKDCERLLGARPPFATLVEQAGATKDLAEIKVPATAK